MALRDKGTVEHRWEGEIRIQSVEDDALLNEFVWTGGGNLGIRRMMSEKIFSQQLEDFHLAIFIMNMIWVSLLPYIDYQGYSRQPSPLLIADVGRG